MSSKGLPDDEYFNITFVQAVEKHPCLYDYTIKEYSIRYEQDKAWNQVAELFGSTGTECKKRWKNLRGSLTRYLKLNRRNAERKKYYLWDVMQFIIPFTKSRAQFGNLPNITNTEDETLEIDSSMDENEEDSKSADPGEEPQFTHPQLPLDIETYACTQPVSNSSAKKRKVNQMDDFESAVVGYLSQHKERKLDNPDMAFFKSILPDVGALTATQKRRFKIGVLQTLENLLQEDSTSENFKFTDRSTSNSPLIYSPSSIALKVEPE